MKAQNLQPDARRISVTELHFDPENPRFPPEVAHGSIEVLIERFVRDERLLEIINSIADQGYFEGEPLLVVPDDGGGYRVIEGNRRLAALKLLSGEVDAPEGRMSIEEACASAQHRPSEVPCLVFESSDQILRYLGFRHITGIKSWSPLQKARYLKRMRDQFYVDLDGREQLKLLAREIGSRADYVGQMLAALNLYERAEKQNFYDVPGLEPGEIDFSVLATALSYSNITDYVGLESRQDVVGDGVSDNNLKQLLSWMFVARANQKAVLGDSRRLRYLAAVVESPNARAMLVKDGNLDAAYQFSRGPAIALNAALSAIEKRLQDAWQWIPLIDKHYPSDDECAETIRKLAVQIRDAIRAKANSSDDD